MNLRGEGLSTTPIPAPHPWFMMDPVGEYPPQWLRNDYKGEDAETLPLESYLPQI